LTIPTSRITKLPLALLGKERGKTQASRERKPPLYNKERDNQRERFGLFLSVPQYCSFHTVPV